MGTVTETGLATGSGRRTEPGRRAEKKAATREALQRAAARMFEERGFQNTTVKDIAAAAGVTERTFFRYFPSKEDLVYSEVLDLLPPLQAEIRSRPAEESPLTTVLNGLAVAAAQSGSAFAILFVGMPARADGAPSRPTRPVLVEFEDGIAAALTPRLRRQHPDEEPWRLAFRASVLARAAVGAMRSALIAYADRAQGHRSPGTFLELLDDAFAVLRTGG